MKSPIILSHYYRWLLIPVILFAFMQLQAADYALDFDATMGAIVTGPDISIKQSKKSFLIRNSHHHTTTVRYFTWTVNGTGATQYELGKDEPEIEFVHAFAEPTCSPLEVRCEITVRSDGRTYLLSTYKWHVTVSWENDITPTNAWQTISSSHEDNLAKTYRVLMDPGYSYTFKTGCGDGATANYDTYLRITGTSCNGLAYDDNSCSGNRSIVSYTTIMDGVIYVRVSGKPSWSALGAGGSYTLAYRRESCAPDATSVSGGGTFCGRTTLTASGGSGGTIYFQGTTSNGTNTSDPATSKTVSESGKYYFRARSDEGCWGPQGSASVVINPLPASTTVSGGGTFCGSATLTASGGAGGGIYYQGLNENGTSTAQPVATRTVTSSGVYYFRSRSHEGCWGKPGKATLVINSLPAATTVSGGGTYCSSKTLTASGGAGGTIYWQARNSNGTFTDKPETSHTVSSSGTYYFRSGSAEGCWGTQGSATVTINKPGTVTVSGGGSYCGTTTLTASGGSDGTIYYQGNVSEGTSTTKPGTTATVSTSGTYYFRARSATGCWGDQGSATVTIGIPEATTVTGGGTYCGSAVLNASGGSGGTLYYQGTTSNGTSTAEPAGSKTVSASGTYYFRAKNAGDCWGTQGSATVTINPVPVTTTVTGGGTWCGSTTLAASGGTGGTIYFQGTTSGGTSTAEPVTSKVVAASGTYYFRAANSGCWGPQGNAAVTINPVPGATTVSGEGSFCGSTTLTASGGSGGTIYYQGTTGNGTSTAEPATSKTITASGTYYFRARSTEGCWGQEDDAAVTIGSGYTAGVSIQVSPGNIIDQGMEVTFTAINDNGIPSPLYQWKLNGSDIGSNTDELRISGLHEGDQVSCTMTSAALCVTGLPALSNTITMTVHVTNAIAEVGWANSLLIYPNPSNGEFVIEMKIPQSGNITLKLLNMTGQVIHAENLKTMAGDYSKLLSVDGLVPGVYNLQLQSGSASVCRRILIE